LIEEGEMSRIRRVTLAAVAAALVVVVVLRFRPGDSGAGGDSPTGPSRPTPGGGPFDEVHARTLAATAVRYLSELVVAIPDDAVVGLRDEGAVDTRRRRMWRTVTLSEDGRPEPTFRLMADGDALFVAPGHLAEALELDPYGWVGAERAVDEAAWSGSPLRGSARLLRDLLLQAAGPVNELGRERVRGTMTTHLRATVPSLDREANGGGSVVDIWVDADDRLRRLEAVVGPNEGTGRASLMSMRLDLFGYGEPVRLDLPDEAEVVANDMALLRTVLSQFGRV
jgi:hypothetical protein